ncbi:hypothetical protein L218DRAFT_871368 [Marasmius fiardii PR-910]|nr:hypothetical protein L218DRAFT_871368 [Marasmius fiardii PR-910]
MYFSSILIFTRNLPLILYCFKDRALRYNWTGLPKTAPSLSLVQGKSSLLSVYASWNGATEINKWEVLGSSSGDGSGAISLLNRSKTGFETTMTVTADYLERYSYFAIRAIDRDNNVLGTSDFQHKNGGVSRTESSGGAIRMGVLLVWLVFWIS